jgi:hypothetical protein
LGKEDTRRSAARWLMAPNPRFLNDDDSHRLREFMKISVLILVAISVCLSAIGGCASFSEMNRMDDFNATVKTYEKMVFWSEFDAALSFMEPEQNGDKDPDMDSLKKVRVTSYKVKRFRASADKSQVLQQVVINYYRMDDVTVKTIEDQQLWIYNADAKRWYLRSGLPAFK